MNTTAKNQIAAISTTVITKSVSNSKKEDVVKAKTTVVKAVNPG